MTSAFELIEPEALFYRGFTKGCLSPCTAFPCCPRLLSWELAAESFGESRSP